jgi:hypothetical protein
LQEVVLQLLLLVDRRIKLESTSRMFPIFSYMITQKRVATHKIHRAKPSKSKEIYDYTMGFFLLLVISAYTINRGDFIREKSRVKCN